MIVQEIKTLVLRAGSMDSPGCAAAAAAALTLWEERPPNTHLDKCLRHVTWALRDLVAMTYLKLELIKHTRARKLLVGAPLDPTVTKEVNKAVSRIKKGWSAEKLKAEQALAICFPPVEEDTSMKGKTVISLYQAITLS